MVLVSYKLLKEYGSIKTIVCVFELAVVRRLLHAGLCDILPLRGEPHDHGGVYHGIVLPHRSADARHVQNPEAHLWPSEVVTLGLLHARSCTSTLRIIPSVPS